MKKNKLFIYILISLVVLLIFNDYFNIIETYDNCITISQLPSTTDAERISALEKKNLERATQLEEITNKLVYVKTQPPINEKLLQQIGPMQQSISDSQSGDVQQDTKFTGL